MVCIPRATSMRHRCAKSQVTRSPGTSQNGSVPALVGAAGMPPRRAVVGMPQRRRAVRSGPALPAGEPAE
ncbi:hypothetical protein F6X68_03035 [Micromonospora sp. AMSO12t]|nr:hypothetical protein F6X68_03035 [Micromonospora sp. AMSO12t]